MPLAAAWDLIEGRELAITEHQETTGCCPSNRDIEGLALELLLAELPSERICQPQGSIVYALLSYSGRFPNLEIDPLHPSGRSLSLSYFILSSWVMLSSTWRRSGDEEPEECSCFSCSSGFSCISGAVFILADMWKEAFTKKFKQKE